MTPDFLVRHGTQDGAVAREVLDANEYRLPDRLDGLVVDVGAHVGAFARACLDRGARVVCFEPDAGNYALLCRNVPAADCYRRAVWAADGEVRVTRPTAAATAMAHTLLPAGDPAPAVGLDALLRHYARGYPVRLLKLDAEGAEVPILAGAADLSPVRAVCGEAHWLYPVPGFPGPSKAWFAGRLRALGFPRLDWQDADVTSLFWASR